MKRPQASGHRAKAPGGAARLRYEALAEDFQRKEPLAARFSAFELAPLLRFFRRRVVTDLDASSAVEYALQRQKQGAEDRTINRELRTLAALLRLAWRTGKLKKDFSIPLLPDDSARPAGVTRRNPVIDAILGRPAGGPRRLTAGGGRLLAEGEAPAAVAKKHGSLSDEDIGAVLDAIPIGKRKLGGSLFFHRDRVEWLKKEREVVIDRSTFSKRLKLYRHPAPTP